ncbi:MAG: hypothetical protein CMH59_12115, partial [Myxococcales bacterium]|nr:hypothetical protein [Myxococcales bacterium]
RIAEEAALRLAELEAHAAIERLLVNGGEGAVVAARVAGLLPDAARERLRALLPGASTPLAPEVRFRLAMELGEPEHAASAARAPLEGESWLGEADALALRDALGDDAFARALAPSPHPRAYRAAMRLALWRPRDFADTLRAFLEQGAEREVELRRAVAKVLRTELGDDLGAPLWIARAFEVAQGRGPFEGFPHLGPPTLASVLAAGDPALERCMLEWLDALPDPLDAAATLLAEGVGPVTRERAAARLGRAADRDALASRARRVRDLAEIFVWGMHRARELTGSVFRIHLTHGDALGYTRLTRQAIHVSGLPVLRGDRRARAIVEGLVLHELGHHVHHASGPALEVWAQAREEGLGGLLNLVADEHLERNLRARDATWGTRLRRLCAWAFQHTQRELSARRLVDALGLAAARVLPGAGLAIAHRPDAVRVRSGALLAALEAHRPAFARFVRALRMGLGDRHDDPAVRAGLALFDRRFRHRDMAGLLEIARALRRLYGEEARLVELVGGHETVPGAGREGEVCGEGIGDADVQEEVERILEAPSRSGARARPGKDRPVVNVGPRRDFDRIHDVRPAPPAPAAHAELARELARPARHLRRALEQLGLAHRPARFRLRGHRFDRTRARAVVLRGDPRMLVARERVRRADLFIGVAIDCSGSMGSGACMDKARRFGVLLAEAAAGLAGVDVRFVGFEDQVLWDAGSANRPAVAALEPGGGNNDAAALWHVAELARRSRRSARLLVMISDGLPTECSTTALRGLVRELEGEGLACAQVAVRALAERCFDHYVEVLEPDVAVASRAFGDIVTGLVARTLRG